MIKRSKTRVCSQWGLCLALVSVLSPALQGRPQGTARTNDFLPPPRADLLPLHWPDLTKLEADVREQLMSLQAGLAATVKKTEATEATLSEAYGTMGEIYQAYSLNTPARECYLNANRLMPKDFRWVYLLGKLDQLEDHADEAIRRYQIARTLRPEYLAVPVNLGGVYLQLNRLEDAKQSFK